MLHTQSAGSLTSVHVAWQQVLISEVNVMTGSVSQASFAHCGDIWGMTDSITLSRHRTRGQILQRRWSTESQGRSLSEVFVQQLHNSSSSKCCRLSPWVKWRAGHRNSRRRNNGVASAKIENKLCWLGKQSLNLQSLNFQFLSPSMFIPSL